MSRTLHCRALVAGAALLLSALPLSARQTNEELRERIRVLEPVAAEAWDEAQAVRARRELAAQQTSASTVDTFAVGPVRVVALPHQRELATEIIGEALEPYLPWADESAALSEQLVSFQWAVSLQPIHMEGPHRRVEATRLKLRGAMVEDARTAVGSILAAETAGTRVGDWYGGAVRFPLVPGTVYRMLTGYRAEINERCLSDGGTACWTALGGGMDDTPLDDWYTAAERMALVGRFYGMRRDRIRDGQLRENLARCLDEERPAACDAVIDGQFGYPNRYAPLGQADARPALLMIALQAGGDGAWARLTEDLEREPGEALLYVSGLTPEELGNRWQAWVLADPPETYAGFGTRSLITLLWILAFAALAMRSTRWRLG
ncbi:MAG: hypothetical protein RJQ04_17595 [Longimicrobiales bacterium]